MSDRPLTLLLVDEDPIFRLGLVTALANQTQVQVIGQVDNAQALWEQCKHQVPDLVLLDPLFLHSSTSGWELCQSLRRTYPDLKICLLTASLDYSQLLKAKAQGIEGYFPKGTAIAQIVTGLEKIYQGETDWLEAPTTSPRTPLSPQYRWLLPFFQSGLGQIDHHLTVVENVLEQTTLSGFDQLFWSGRKRELQTAQWLVKHLMPASLRWQTQLLVSSPSSPSFPSSAPPLISNSSMIEGSDSAPFLIQKTYANLQIPTRNLTTTPLELDILQTSKRQELLLLVLNQLQSVVRELKTLEITPEQLPDNLSPMLVEIWQTVTLSFFGKYCSPKSSYRLDTIQAILTPYRELIQTESLDKIPFVPEILQYLLFTEPSEASVNSLDSEPENGQGKRGENLSRLELYLHHLIVQLANSVMVFILNYFSDNEEIKQTLYQIELLSSREIAKFRNNLAWHYQLNQYWLEPKNIFESHYQLFYFSPQGIALTTVYSPRQAELAQLQGLARTVTLLLELRDALSPRLRSLVKFLGKGFVFALTQVIGRAIGLMIKGILQGIGNSWQETRYSRSRSSNFDKF